MATVFLSGTNGMINVVVRTKQTFFFTTESGKNDRASRALGRKDAREFEHARNAGSVIVGAMMNFAFA